MDNINKQCLEKILCHLTKLICLTEFGEEKELSKLIDMATSVSAQLNVTNNPVHEEVETEKRLAIPLALADGWEPYNNYLSFT